MFLDDFNCVADIVRDFQIEDQAASDLYRAKIIIAWYTYECYSGDAYVLYELDGKLYEAEGGHCSCYGLEGQWEPSETNVEAVQHILEKGSRYGMDGHKRAFTEAFKAYLESKENNDDQAE